MPARLQHATSLPPEKGVRPRFHGLRKPLLASSSARLLIVLSAAAWGALVLWHYYAPLVQAFGGAIPFFDHPLLFDRSVRPFTDVGEALERSARAIAGAAAVLVACAGLGRAILSSVRALFHDALEQFLFEIGIGFGALSFVLFAMAAAHVYTPPVVASVVAAFALISAAGLIRRGLPSLRTGRLDVRGLPGWSYAFAACAVLAAGFALIGALAPETEYDALWYHLWIPQQWLQAGHPVDIVQEYISLYPATWELLYGGAITIGGVVAAKLLHWICLTLLAGAAAALARVAFPRADPALAAALCLTAPTMLWEGTTAYVDLVPAFFITLSAVALWRYAERARRSWLVLAAVTMGIALAVKNLSLVAAAVVGVAVLLVEWRRTHSMRQVIGAAALFAAVALAPPLPWYARAYAAAGNPVFPDMYRVFGARPAERWDDRSEQGLAAFKAHFGQDKSPQSATGQISPGAQSSSSSISARRYVSQPWDLTVHASRYGASFGPLFLILAPFAFAIRRQRASALAIGCGMAAFVAIWASPISSVQGRFLVPLVPCAAVLAAAGAATIDDAAGRARHLVAAILVALLVVNLPPFIRWHEADRRGWEGWLTHVTRALPVAVVTGGESTRAYLERTVPSYRAWEFIDRTVPPDATVLTFSGGDHLYSHRRRIWSDATIARAVTWGAPAGRERDALSAARALGIGYVLMDKRQRADTHRLAIGSDAMRACCLERLYEDESFVVYRIR